MQDESWLHDATCSTAVCSFNSNIPVIRHGTGLGHAWLEIEDILVCSVYMSPNVELGVFEETLDELSRLRNAVCKDVVICGDFNAKNVAWGAGVTDRRGLFLEELMAVLGLICLNDGELLTLVRVNGVFFVSPGLARMARCWLVLKEEETLSDHEAIYFEVGAS
ncbi:uncharacterized protein LOC142317836 [Lycorma delicatula]|uniref:uncharacterized protein LOC142317836 n=1 Tax=Lycorma delicatula TaxID=130591 RepID=UPI003F5114AC